MPSGNFVNPINTKFNLFANHKAPYFYSPTTSYTKNLYFKMPFNLVGTNFNYIWGIHISNTTGPGINSFVGSGDYFPQLTSSPTNFTPYQLSPSAYTIQYNNSPNTNPYSYFVPNNDNILNISGDKEIVYTNINLCNNKSMDQYYRSIPTGTNVQNNAQIVIKLKIYYDAANSFNGIKRYNMIFSYLNCITGIYDDVLTFDAATFSGIGVNLYFR